MAKYFTEKEFVGQCGPLPEHLRENMEEVLEIMDVLREEWGKPLKVNSGYRSVEHNKKIGGSPKSSHCFAQAIDIADPQNEFYDWIVANKKHEELDFYMEDKSATKTWCHITTRAQASKNIIFKP